MYLVSCLKGMVDIYNIYNVLASVSGSSNSHWTSWNAFEFCANSFDDST